MLERFANEKTLKLFGPFASYKEIFLNAAPSVDMIKLLSLSLMVGQNKLEWDVFLAFLMLQIRLLVGWPYPQILSLNLETW
jgi:hypothetical protein